MSLPAERYFDYAASAPPFPEALQAQSDAAARWFGNPSAAHGPGREAHAEWERLKAALAGLCGFTEGRLVVTSGATEANNMVLHAVMARHPQGRVALAADVHASLWNAAHRPGCRVDVIPLDAGGRLTAGAVGTALRPDTVLLCCSHVANETGIIHDVAAMARQCRERGVLCLVDGSQALGHVPVDLAGIACDTYTFSAHKFGGPRGCGGVFWRGETHGPLLWGGGQEDGLRPGTENLPGLAGTVEALARAVALLPAEAVRLRGLAAALEASLRAAGIAFETNSDATTGLPGLVSLSFEGVEGTVLAADLALQGFAVATGSACHADQVEPSRAILAIGRSPSAARGTIRVALGRLTTGAAVTAFGRVLAETVDRQRGKGGCCAGRDAACCGGASCSAQTPASHAPDLAALREVSPAMARRLRGMVERDAPYFILSGSDPADANGCCASSEVGEANRLVQSGILASHRPAPVPGACTTTVYAFAGEVGTGSDTPQFQANQALRDQVRVALDEAAWRRRGRLRVLARYLLVIAFTASLTLAVRKAVLGARPAGTGANLVLDRALGIRPDDQRLWVVFFQEDASCEPCRTMRRLTEQTLRQHFQAAVDAGRLALREIRLGDPANRSLRASLGLGMSSVGLARYREGHCVALKLLTEDAWCLYGDEPAFVEMLRREIGRMDTPP